jgi:hypothetical protein
MILPLIMSLFGKGRRRGGARLYRRGGRRVLKQGAGLLDFAKKAFNFAKDKKLVSTIANTIGQLAPGKIGSIARTVGQAAGAVGMGKRRGQRVYRRGGALRLAGAGARRIMI